MINLQLSQPLLPFQEALSVIFNTVQAITETEQIPLTQGMGRIAATVITSPIAVPSFNNSAMDGYAVRLKDLNKSLILPVADCILAGEQNNPSWPPNTCLRIMTGAKVPDDADAVIMQENTQQTENGICFKSLPKQNENIRFAGEDIQKNEEIITIGTKLTLPLLSCIASLGISTITVFRQITVALFSTGDELTESGTPITPGKIYDTNRFTLHLMLSKLGCRVIDLGIIPDNFEAIFNTFTHADSVADLVISSGGVSVGDADYTQHVLNKMGNINFWKLAIKPGKPFAFGQLNHAIFCGLPGNPVSAIVTFYQLVQPLIAKLSGNNQYHIHHQFKVKTKTPLKKTPGRLDFQRGILTANTQGELEVTTSGQQGSHIVQSMSKANCFIILEQHRGSVTAGEWVTVEFFNALLSCE